MNKYVMHPKHKNSQWVVNHYEYLNAMDKKLTDEQKNSSSELTEISKKYKETTDKGPFTTYEIKHNYTELYDKLIRPYKNQSIKLLEIGVRWGGSLLMWKDFLPDAEVYGIDIARTTNKEVLSCSSIHTFTFDAYNVEQIQAHMPDLKFVVIVDDGSHLPKDQIKSFNIWHKRLNKNGIMIIEDIESIQKAKNIIYEFEGSINQCSIIDRTHCVPSLDDINVVYYS